MHCHSLSLSGSIAYMLYGSMYILQSAGQGATNLQQIHDQLKLALTWNRSDVAEEKIFALNHNWPTGWWYMFKLISIIFCFKSLFDFIGQPLEIEQT